MPEPRHRRWRAKEVMNDSQATLTAGEQDLQRMVRTLLDALFAPYGWTGHTVTMNAINCWKGQRFPDAENQLPIYDALNALSAMVGWEPAELTRGPRS